MLGMKAFSARVFAFVLVVIAILAASARGDAQSLDSKAIPDPLKPWTEWALAGKDDTLCATFDGNAANARCAWPSRLALDLDEKGGKFAQAWHLDAKRWVPLPGDAKRWPQDVKLDGKRAVVIAQAGAPSIEIEAGDHAVVGAFLWDSLPESLHIPSETGLLALSIRGAAVPQPNRDAQGTVWLQKTTSAEEGDNLSVVVHRKATDDIPLVLTTHIELHVSGKNREVLLGRALPSGFLPMAIVSPLPARVEPDGRLRVQARPGVFTIELVARSPAPVTTLARPTPEGPWREGDEVWVFEAKNDLRVVSVEGVASIDPQQTTLPDAWKRFPAYPMKIGDTLRLVEKRRGDADPPPNQLTLRRVLWLDFDGGGYTATDKITGTMTRDWRLTMAPPTILGRVAVAGKDQFITHLTDAAQTGVEIRQGNLSITADSRIPGSSGDVPAVGWAHDFHQVSGALHVPPGWRLLHATGVDSVPGTWVRHWSLLELFLALIVAIAIGRLFGVKWGAISLAMLALTLPEGGAPKWTWLVVLAFEALVRVLPDGRAKKVFSWARVGGVVLLAVVTLPFLVEHVRQGLFPALASSATASGGDVFGDFDRSEDKDQLEGPAPDSEVAPAPMDLPKNAPKKPPSGAAGGPIGGKLDEPTPQRPDESYRAPLAPQPSAAPQAPPPGGTSFLGGFSRSSVDTRWSNAQAYDPTAAVQTGPGLPRWKWTTLDLTWSGPVTSTQRMHLYLLSPAENLGLAFVRALLLVAVLLRFLPWKLRLPRTRSGPPAAAATALAVLVAVVALPVLAHAQVPDRATLDDLRDRLTKKAACAPTCASSSRLAIELRGAVLRARMDVDAAARTAIPLPGGTQWTPTDVLLDGKPALALVRMNDGVLWIELAPGPHQISLSGPMPDRESMQLALNLKPHRVETASEGWTVAGLHEDGLADDNLQFTRVRKAEGTAAGSLQPGTLPPFVRIERTLEIGLNWQVSTRIVRLTPAGSAIVLEVPLLAGESVTTADVRVVGGKVLVNMGPQVSEAAWHSTLEQKSPLKLTADKSLAWIEVWRADVGPIWHATYGGIPFVHTETTGDVKIPEWRPWPGEEATVTLARPEGVEGQTLTIDQSRAQIAPGVRATDVTLTLGVRSSRGAQHTITLPEGAQLESLNVNGIVQPVRQDGRRVTIGIVPGAQTITLAWREPRGIDFRFASSSIDLGAPSVNATVAIEVPAARWLLFAGGPRLGPAVLFWSLFLVLLVVGAALGRVRWTPLRAWHWMLLAIGLSQVGVIAGAFFVGWLLVLGWRKERPTPTAHAVTFNLRQIAIVVWTLGALTVLGISMYQGLLGSPDMQVRGNGSSAHSLQWFTDRSGAALPDAWIVSVPILAYRAVMLAWALWAALALLRWIKWGWGAFTEGGAWKKLPPPRPRPMAPPGYGAPAGYGPPMPPWQPPPPQAPPPPPEAPPDV